MEHSGLRPVVADRRVNAGLSWLFVLALLVGAVVGAAGGELLWAGFVLVVAALALIPPVALRSPTAMLPWEVLALASLPVLARLAIVGQEVGGVTLTGRVATYLAVAAVALIVAVELDVFTPVKMNYSFAVAFVAVTTMAAAGLWAVGQWLADMTLGTAFLERGGSAAAAEQALMWDFVAATVAGVAAGGLFELYFRRRARGRDRVPPAVRPPEEPLVGEADGGDYEDDVAGDEVDAGGYEDGGAGDEVDTGDYEDDAAAGTTAGGGERS